MGKTIPTLLSPLKNEHGLANVLVALSIVVLLGFTALVVDIGAIYLEKSRLQKALDAAVLGGAQQLIVSQQKAKETAKDLAFKNGFTVVDAEIKTETGAIEIEKTVKKEMVFARILGIDESNICAIARAESTFGITATAGVVPVGLEVADFKKGAQYVINNKSGEGNSVVYGYLAIDGKGASELEKAIKTGSKKTIKLNDMVETEPGHNMGPVEIGFTYRIDQDKTKTHCNVYNTVDNTCSRYVIVPLIDSFGGVNGRDKVKVIGFAALWIESVSINQITFRFIDDLTSDASKVKLVK